MDAIITYRIQKAHVVYLFMFLLSCSCFSQSTIGFLKYDQAIYNQTINQVYKSWNESNVSKEHQMDTILCVFLADFDTLNLKRIELNEEALKRNMKFKL